MTSLAFAQIMGRPQETKQGLCMHLRRIHLAAAETGEGGLPNHRAEAMSKRIAAWVVPSVDRMFHILPV